MELLPLKGALLSLSCDGADPLRCSRRELSGGLKVTYVLPYAVVWCASPCDSHRSLRRREQQDAAPAPACVSSPLLFLCQHSGHIEYHNLFLQRTSSPPSRLAPLLRFSARLTHVPFFLFFSSSTSELDNLKKDQTSDRGLWARQIVNAMKALSRQVPEARRGRRPARGGPPQRRACFLMYFVVLLAATPVVRLGFSPPSHVPLFTFRVLTLQAFEPEGPQEYMKGRQALSNSRAVRLKGPSTLRTVAQRNRWHRRAEAVQPTMPG